MARAWSEEFGSISGDASPGDAIILNVNGQSFNGVLDANLDFSVDVNGIDLSLDANSTIDVFVDAGLCTLTGGIEIDIPDLIIPGLVIRWSGHLSSMVWSSLVWVIADLIIPSSGHR